MKYKSIYIFFLFVICTVSFSSCFLRKNDEIIKLEDEGSLDLSPTVKWCIITDSYASLRENPSEDAKILTHCRQGDIFRINSLRIEENTRWYLLYGENNEKKGFIKEDSVKVCDNKYRAESESLSLQKQETQQ
ncbi:MAG: hypothetical protein K6F69_09035 [Treponema sp.]|nr:hypothetical protein [Treponema sp.]